MVGENYGISFEDFNKLDASERRRLYRDIPEVKARFNETAKLKGRRPDVRAQKDAYRNDPENIEKRIAYDRKRRQDPEFRAAEAERQKRYLNTPEGRAADNAATARRKAAKLRATPAWLNKAHHAEMDAKFLYNQIMPGNWDVDHIEALQGFKRADNPASGLHVPWNLQIMDQSTNAGKGNRQAGMLAEADNPLSPKREWVNKPGAGIKPKKNFIDHRLLRGLKRVGRGGLLGLPLAALSMFGKTGEAMAATEDSGYGLLKEKGFDVRKKIDSIQNPILRGGAKTAEFLLGDVAFATGLVAHDLKALEKSRKKSGKRIRRRPGMLAS